MCEGTLGRAGTASTAGVCKKERQYARQREEMRVEEREREMQKAKARERHSQCLILDAHQYNSTQHLTQYTNTNTPGGSKRNQKSNLPCE